MRKAPFEVTILVENHPCDVMRVISSSGMRAHVENVRLREQSTDHIVLFDGEVSRDDVQRLRQVAVKVLKISSNRVWVRTNGCAVCRVLYTSDVVVENIKVVSNNAILYTMLVPNSTSLRELLSNLVKSGVKVTVLSISEVTDAVLTDRQIEILKLAYKLGYFDDDRKITLTQLAEKLGISTPTLDEVLRKALRKVVKYYLDRHG